MRVILGLDRPDSGTALVEGKPYRSLEHPLRHAGSLLDAGALQPSRTARGHLQWLARSQALPARRAGEVPLTDGPSGLGETLSQTLGGAFLALIILAVVGAMFVTSEYRRGLIRVTLAACPRRGRVLAAKAGVASLVAFVAGLAGTAVAVPLGQRMLRDHGVYLPAVTRAAEVRVIVGTAAALAVCAVLAVGIGTVVRRGVAAVAAAVTLIVLPCLLAVTAPVLPASRCCAAGPRWPWRWRTSR